MRIAHEIFYVAAPVEQGPQLPQRRGIAVGVVADKQRIPLPIELLPHGHKSPQGRRNRPPRLSISMPQLLESDVQLEHLLKKRGRWRIAAAVPGFKPIGRLSAQPKEPA